LDSNFIRKDNEEDIGTHSEGGLIEDVLGVGGRRWRKGEMLI
jgi:hypothetical protein